MHLLASTEPGHRSAITKSEVSGSYFIFQVRHTSYTTIIVKNGKSSPRSKFWGRISGGRPRGYPGGRPGPKTSVKPRNSGKKLAFRCGQDAKARTSMTPARGLQKKTSVRKISGWEQQLDLGFTSRIHVPLPFRVLSVLSSVCPFVSLSVFSLGSGLPLVPILKGTSSGLSVSQSVSTSHQLHNDNCLGVRCEIIRAPNGT